MLSIDAAWAVFEDSLPDGWAIARIEFDGNEYGVAAFIPVNRGVGWRWGRAVTLAEAFRILIERITR